MTGRLDNAHSPRGIWIGRFSALRRSSRNQEKSWQTECLHHLQSSSSLDGISPKLSSTVSVCNSRPYCTNCDGIPSLVMNEMNSDTHSCMHSFASLAIFAFSGRAVFIILATGAKLRMLASEAAWFLPALEADDESRAEFGDWTGEEEAWDMLGAWHKVQAFNRLRSKASDWSICRTCARSGRHQVKRCHSAMPRYAKGGFARKSEKRTSGRTNHLLLGAIGPVL